MPPPSPPASGDSSPAPLSSSAPLSVTSSSKFGG
jgi:hypothetical protein